MRPTPESRLRVRERPRGFAAMTQRWDDLLFAHWETSPEAIQRTLPEGLMVDTWEGSAFIGVVPFFMNRVRPAFLPALPWLSYFMELNVRTYVHDRDGNPGVWFYSLDCNQPIAVRVARRFFGLPYKDAAMSMKDGAYDCRRSDGKAAASFAYKVEADTHEATPETLEWFLTERYMLFSMKGGRLYRGQVHHSPYPLSTPSVRECDIRGLAPSGIALEGPPTHIVGSPGVSVEIFGVERVSFAQTRNSLPNTT